MLICYLDEAGNTGRRLDDPDQPRHFVVAVMVREDRVREMTDRLDELAARVPLRVPLVEYHGYDLFHGEGVWEGLYPRQRIDEYEKAISVLGEVRADIAYASINKPALAEKSYANPNPHTFALQFLVERSSDGSGAGRMNSAKGHCWWRIRITNRNSIRSILSARCRPLVDRSVLDTG